MLALLFILRKTASFSMHTFLAWPCSVITANRVFSCTRDSDVTFKNLRNTHLNYIQYGLFYELTRKFYILSAVTFLFYAVLRHA